MASGAAQLASCSPCRSPKIRFNVNWKLPIGGALERGLSSALWISCLAVLSYSFISYILYHTERRHLFDDFETHHSLAPISNISPTMT